MANILIIEDEELVRLTVRQCLEMFGHSVREAENGVQGVRMVQENTPDLLITDLIMPEKEGVETIAEVRSMHPQLPIIAMSGGGRIGSKDYLATAKMLGANITLAKPFTPDVLKAAVDELLGTEAQPDTLAS